MIDYIDSPLPCVFSKNPVNFKLFADDWSTEIDVFPSILLNFEYRDFVGRFFQFQFTNPITKTIETITFIGTTNPDDSGNEVPAGVGTVNTESALMFFISFLKKNTLLSSFYNVELVGFKVLIVAKEGIQELIPKNYYDNFPSPYSITPVITTAFWKARKRPGHRINFNIYFEKEYNSNVFELVSSQNDTVDSKGYQEIDIASVLDSEIRNSFFTPPLPLKTNPNATNITQKAKVLRRFYIEASEQWKGMLEPVQWVKSDIRHVHFGGVSMDDYSRENPINYLAAEKEPLTWWRDKKRIYPSQNDWLSVMNVSNQKDTNYHAVLNILYKDGTSQNFDLGGQELLPWETITIPVGFNQLDIEGKQDPLKEVYGWRIDVLNSNEEVITNRTYLLHQAQNFRTNTIVYLNSFGVAESFVCSGFFENNLVTTSEIASKTLKHDYLSINGRDFVFNKNSKNTFKARSGVLNKAEAAALQSMLNVAPVFLLEKDLLRPIIIDPASFVIDDESEITQTLDFKITKSMELTNVSEMITKPTLSVVANCGMLKISVNSDEVINIYNDLIIRHKGLIFDTISYSNGYESTIKIQENGNYSLECSVDINGESFDLVYLYEFKREEVSFNSPPHTSPTNTMSFTIGSRKDETLRLTNQDANPVDFNLVAHVETPILLSVQKGVKRHTISGSCLSNVFHFQIESQGFSNFNLEKMVNLEALVFIDCNIAGHFSTANFKNLKMIYITGCGITSFEVGMKTSLQSLILDDNNMNSQAIESLIEELYLYRKLFTYEYDVIVSLIGNPGIIGISQNAINMKDGLAEYSGDGLIQNGIQIHL